MTEPPGSCFPNTTSAMLRVRSIHPPFEEADVLTMDGVDAGNHVVVLERCKACGP